MPKRKGPAGFVVYPDDFFALPPVVQGTASEIGAYVLLWMAAWDDGLPDDDAVLRRISRLGNKWPMSRALILSRFVKIDGRLWNVDSLEARRKIDEKRAKTSASGIVGARARWGGDNSR